MSELLNQHQLAERIKRSRVSIIQWEKRGLPVAQDQGRGKQKLYDPAAVLAWMERTGIGGRIDLPRPPAVQTSALPATASEIEIQLSRVISATVPGLVFLALRRGFSAEVALEIADELVCVAYAHLERYLGRESLLLMDSDGLQLLIDPAGRQLLIENAKRSVQEYLAEGNA